MPLPSTKPPTPPTGSRRISDWLKYIFEAAIYYWAYTTLGPIGVALEDWISKLLGFKPKPQAAPPNSILDFVLSLPGTPPEAKRAIQEAMTRANIEQSAVAVLYSVIGAMGLIGGPSGVVGRSAAFGTEEVFRTARPSPAELWAMTRRGSLDAGTMQQYLKETGWPDDLITAWADITRPLLSAMDLGAAYLRGEIGEGEFSDDLRKRGYSARDTDVIKALTQLIPGPTDLVRMAVREAWNESVVRTFGYDEGFPAEFGEWTAKQGLSSEWAKRYWRAHWALPSIQLGYEMLHRGEIDDRELMLLLQASDIPAFWRQKLINISYHPYTRVDARRMFELGVLSEEDVYQSYRDEGYNEERARKLTEWTIKEYGFGQESKMINEALAAFTKGLMNEEETRSVMTQLEVPKFQQDADIAMATLRRQNDLEAEQLKNIQVAYVGMEIDESKARDLLATLNPPGSFIEQTIAVWKVQRERKLKKLTVAQIRDFWVSGIIEEGAVDKEMAKNGYSKQYSEWFKVKWILDYIGAEGE